MVVKAPDVKFVLESKTQVPRGIWEHASPPPPQEIFKIEHSENTVSSVSQAGHIQRKWTVKVKLPNIGIKVLDVE